MTQTPGSEQDSPQTQPAANGAEPRSYVRSTIPFPYGDLDDAIRIAEVVYNHYGGAVAVGTVAGVLKQSEKSGAFRTKISTAQMFGAVTHERGWLRTTELGQAIVDLDTRADALVEAFKRVPLYAALLEKYGSGVLPRDSGLEAVIVDMGVSPKQAERARQAFIRSAEIAGFFRHGKDRLVEPPRSGARSSIDAVAPTATLPATEGKAAAQSSAGLHPLLAGLMRELPPEGNDFPADKRRDWLEAATVIFRLVYGKDDESAARFAQAADPTDSEGR